MSVVAGRYAGEQAAWPALIDGRPLKWAEIDPAALRANAAALRRHTGAGVGVIAMVKANGYGHGAVLASRAFLDGGATWLSLERPWPVPWSAVDAAAVPAAPDPPIYLLSHTLDPGGHQPQDHLWASFDGGWHWHDAFGKV